MAGLVLVSAFNLTAALPPLPDAWLDVRWVVLLAGFALILFALAAAHFSWRDRETLAIALLLLGMMPLGLSIAEGQGRFGNYLSLANAAAFLEPRLGEKGEVIFEGPARAGSSLPFYLARPPLFVETATDRDLILDRLASPHPVFLIIHKDRAPYWQEQLTERFHIYHQAATCGPYVVITGP